MTVLHKSIFQKFELGLITKMLIGGISMLTGLIMGMVLYLIDHPFQSLPILIGSGIMLFIVIKNTDWYDEQTTEKKEKTN